MTLSKLVIDIRAYHSSFELELAYKNRFIDLIENHDNCLERSLLKGHITGSAWIINPERTHALLTHHMKLDKWLQLGGHADGDSDILNVAQREAHEESGLKSIIPIGQDIFDIDIHTIPAKGKEPQHEHFDIRHAFEADMKQGLMINHESKALKWVLLDEISQLVDNSESIMRMVEKTAKLKLNATKNN